MTNELKKVPELRFPEFDGEWEKKRLGEVVNYKNGGSFESLVKNHGVYKLITLKSVNTEGKLINSEKYIDDKCVETLRKDTLVMILSEQAPGLVGMTAIIPNNNEYVLNQRVAALVPNQFIDSQFLSKLINRNQKYFSVRSAGTKVKNISKGHVESFNFLSPDYTEQQKIGEFFSKLDRQIELEEQKLKKLEEQKKGYMQKIFSQELRFKDENGNEYPEWEEKNFLDIFKVVPGKSNQIKSSEVMINGNIPVVDQGKNKFLGYSNQMSKRIENYNDLIVYGDHTTVIKKIDEPFIIGGDGVKLLTSKDGSLVQYLFVLLQYFNVIPEGYKRHFSILKTKNMKFSSSKKEQEKIGEFFKQIDNFIEKQSNKVESLKQRKQGLLQKMFI